MLRLASLSGEAGQCGQLSQILPQRTRRSSPYRLAGAHDLRRQDPRSRPNHRPSFDPRLIPHTNLAPNHRIIPNRDAARQTGLSHNQNMTPDRAIVPYMNQVV